VNNNKQVSLYWSKKNNETKEEDIFYTPAAENCPEPADGVLRWHPPNNEVYTEECLIALKEWHAKHPFLRTLRQPKKVYPSIRGFFHITQNVASYLTQSRNEAIFETQLQKLNNSGLLDYSSLQLRIGLMGQTFNSSFTECVKSTIERRVQQFANMAEIEYVDPSDHECGTIRSLQKWCRKNEQSFVYYLHNKGITHLSHGFIFLNDKDWVDFMMFFLFERWRLCVNSLTNGAAACGVNKRNFPFRHFSGNFWWSSCKHINKVTNPCPLGRQMRFAAEFWLISNDILLRESKITELWDRRCTIGKPCPRNSYNCHDQLFSFQP
jgi:hypothetical protein